MRRAQMARARTTGADNNKFAGPFDRMLLWNIQISSGPFEIWETAGEHHLRLWEIPVFIVVTAKEETNE